MSQIPTLSASAQPYDPDNDLSDRDFVKKGFNFWINNQPKESELFFKRRSDRTTVLAGYTFILCMVLRIFCYSIEFSHFINQ